MPVSASFLSYTPVALTFGTSGLRGLVDDITDLEAYINVKGGLRYLLAIGDVTAGSGVVLGGDLRPSTARIMRASARAIVDVGCTVENAGNVPTPALMLHSLATRRAGVMVTGSHIPFDRNGIKINRSVGEVLKTDEAGITREVERVRAEEYAHDAATSAFTARGMLKDAAAVPLPVVDSSAEERYVRRYVDAFGRGGLAGLSVLVYEHSAVGRDLVGRILRELGANVIPAGRAETFIPIDTENITDELLARLDALVVGAEATGGSPRVIVSTDGDSDRPLVAAVHPADPSSPGSERVQFLPGDLLGLVVAEYLGADAVAVPISSNDAIERRMTERGVVLEKTRIGSPYVVASLDTLARSGSHGRIVGWEANGGFLLGSAIDVGKAPLAPLPTRDAVLPMLATLFAAARERVSLSVLWGRLPSRYGRSGLKDNVPVAVSRAILAALVPPGSAPEVSFGEGDTVTAGTDTLDEHSAAPWRKARATLARFFTGELGFGKIARINVLDGVRVYFSSGDVAHIRPSGNAPQLRIYANADSQARADRIVQLGLDEPDGILSSLARSFS